MKSIGLSALFLALACAAPVDPVLAANELPRSAPEAQGVSSENISAFIEEAGAKIDALNSFMLLRHGRVIAEGWWAPYDAATPHQLYSLSKSFTSTAIGLAAAEGRLSVSDQVLSFFPEDAPAEISDNLKAMRIRDLLRMSAGHQSEIPMGRGLLTTKAFLAHPVPFKPGTRFLYNTPATFMLSAIIQKTTGQKVVDYLKTRLFDPIGIAPPYWETNSQGICVGGSGLSVRTEDIARFGQLYLQKGNWDGKQVIPQKWLEEATTLQTSNGSNPNSDWEQGYCYQFWRCRHGGYRGDGAFGQYCLVLPEQDAVVAITSGVKDMQAALNLVWDKLLPALQSDPLPPNPEARQKLSAKLASLTLRPVKGAETSAATARATGKRFVFPKNDQGLESLSFESGPNGDATISMRLNGRDQSLASGVGAWKKGRLQFGDFPERAVATSGAWTSDDTFTANVCFYETPFTLALKLRFIEEQVLCDLEWNVFFGPAKLPRLTGRVE